MEAKNFRVGNWVYDIRGEQDIKCNLQFMKQEDRLYPIPINKSWLIKFAFEKVNENKHYDFYTIEDLDELIIYLHKEKDHVFVMFNGFQLDKYNGQFYVHQLQNLFFAITGEELELTEKSAEL